MMKRILVAGLLGGLVLFAWGAISHMALPIGKVGLGGLPNEAAVLPGLKAIPEPGLFFFPWEEDPKRLEERARVGPFGFIVVDPDGRELMTPGQLIVEFLSNFAAALLAALLLALAAPSLAGYGMRVWFTGLLGLIPCLSILASEWNWYPFPTDYFLAQCVIEIVGWILVGLVLGAVVKRPALA
jgi:hypothetical protein